MIQLNPGETFPIVRVLENPSITDTHYVRAVIKNARTLATVATVNLTDNGSRVFSYNWTVPSDSTFGRGTYILITTSVYVDSGYSSRSENYGDEAQTYLIQERFNYGVHFGGGGGLDERTVRALFDEYLKPLNEIEPIKLPDYPEPIDYRPYIEECFKKLSKELADKPVTPASDLAPIVELLTKTYNEICARPKFEKTDLAPLADVVRQLAQLMSAMDGEHRKGMERMEEMARSAHDEKNQINEFSNGQGGRLTLSMTPSPDRQKTIRLRRLAMKYGMMR